MTPLKCLYSNEDLSCDWRERDLMLYIIGVSESVSYEKAHESINNCMEIITRDEKILEILKRHRCESISKSIWLKSLNKYILGNMNSMIEYILKEVEEQIRLNDFKKKSIINRYQIKEACNHATLIFSAIVSARVKQNISDLANFLSERLGKADAINVPIVLMKALKYKDYNYAGNQLGLGIQYFKVFQYLIRKQRD